MTKHPAAEAAQKLSAKKAEKKQLEAKEEAALTADNSLKYIHIRSFESNGNEQPEANGGATIAYQYANGRRVNVAVAICHRADVYSKAAGRLTAARHLQAGRFVTLRVPRGMTTVNFLKNSFYWTAQQSAE